MRVFSVSQIIVYTCSNCSVILKNHIKPDIKLLDPQNRRFFKLRDTPCKTEQPLQGTKLQQKEKNKD